MDKLFTGILIAILGLGQAYAKDVPQHPRILVFGDSISAAYGLETSAGWVELLKEKLALQGYAHEVVNASISGETTTGGLGRLPHLLEQHQPELVILELGGNDGLQGHPLGLIEQNLRRMIDLIEQTGAHTLLLGMQIPPNLGPLYTERFTALYPAVAQQQDVALVPLLLEQVATEKSLMQNDGIHPNAAGQPILLEAIWPRLRTILDKDGTSSAAKG